MSGQEYDFDFNDVRTAPEAEQTGSYGSDGSVFMEEKLTVPENFPWKEQGEEIMRILDSLQEKDPEGYEHIAKLAEKAFAGEGIAADHLADVMGKAGAEKTRDAWKRIAAEMGYENAFQVCGYLQMDEEPENALKWFEKADRAGRISTANLFNCGLVYYRQGNYQRALDKLQRADQGNHGGASYLMGEMYEYGRGVQKSYPSAVRYYNRADSLGIKGAGDAADRLNKYIDEMHRKTAQQKVFTDGTNTYGRARSVDDTYAGGGERRYAPRYWANTRAPGKRWSELNGEQVSARILDMASYFGVAGFIISLILGDKRDRFHVNQALALMIAGGVASAMLGGIEIFEVLGGLITAGVTIARILCILKAFTGAKFVLPFLGKIQIIK